MFDLFKMMNEHGDTLTKLPQFLDGWIKYMADAKMAFREINDRLDRIDSKLQTLLNGPQSVTEDVHAVVSAWADDDPRNRRIRNGVG